MPKELLPLLLTLFALFLLIALAAAILFKLGLLKLPGKPTAPYCLRPTLLTRGEQAFFIQLQAALPILTANLGKPHPPLLFAKVRLADLIEVDSERVSGDHPRRQSAQNRINQKHVDFVLCAPQDTRPILIIELDDKSHQRQDRIDRDNFVDFACDGADLPILHVRAAPNYNPQSLARDLAAKLTHP